MTNTPRIHLQFNDMPTVRWQSRFRRCAAKSSFERNWGNTAQRGSVALQGSGDPFGIGVNATTHRIASMNRSADL
ncbi:MAG: hypothetical protein ACKO15_03065 [Burkholderiales bacterium]